MVSFKYGLQTLLALDGVLGQLFVFTIASFSLRLSHLLLDHFEDIQQERLLHFRLLMSVGRSLFQLLVYILLVDGAEIIYWFCESMKLA